jgi:hypothetical protein
MSSETDRSRARAARFSQFNFSASVREDNPQTQGLFRAMKEAPRDKAERRRIRDYAKHGIAIAAAQAVCGPGLYVDTYLRNFLREYNGRLMRGEGVHMPSSYSIMHSMIEPHEQAFVLSLLPQIHHVLSFSRMLDHITDPSVDTRLPSSCAAIEDLRIYGINMLGGPAEFRIPGAEDNIFCGAAFCKEGEELSIMGVFGRPRLKDKADIREVDPANIHPGKHFLHASGATFDLSDQPLFGDNRFAPLILLARVDIERSTTHVRMALEETRDTFTVLTDDPEQLTFAAKIGKVAGDKVAESTALLDAYTPLYELLFSVPSCLALMETEDVVLERHPTELRLNPNGKEARLAASLPVHQAPKFVNVRTLYDLGSDATSYEIPASNLSVETSGYWKMLSLGSEGRDKKGHAVQGKTWVSTQSSWYESRSEKDFDCRQPASVEPRRDQDGVGYLYVMRNAAHPHDLYKIGFTLKTPDTRAAQLGSTSGQPDMFNVVQSWHVRSPRLIEHEVHELLKDHRLNDRREFFRLKYEKIREVIDVVITRLGASVEDR